MYTVFNTHKQQFNTTDTIKLTDKTDSSYGGNFCLRGSSETFKFKLCRFNCAQRRADKNLSNTPAALPDCKNVGVCKHTGIKEAPREGGTRPPALIQGAVPNQFFIPVLLTDAAGLFETKKKLHLTRGRIGYQ